MMSNQSGNSAVNTSVTDAQQKTKAQLKAERKAAFEAQRAQQQTSKAQETASTKSKAELKAERRAKQEAQRSAKSSLKQDQVVVKAANTSQQTAKASVGKVESGRNEDIESVKENKNNVKPPEESVKVQLAGANKTLGDKKIVAEATGLRRGNIFAHLPQKHNDIEQLTMELSVNGMTVHHQVVQIGLRMNKGVIKGSNERCVAMLIVFKKVIQDYVTPPSKELARDLEANIDLCVKFLANCRPLSVSMANAVKFLKLTFSKIPASKSDFDSKRDLCQVIDDFITEEIICAQRGISENAITKINDTGDVILIYGYSLIVKHVLFKAYKMGKKFSVIVVDSRPSLGGKEMLKYLLEHNIPTTYVYINAISYAMKEVTKVLLGAHALLANGYVMSNLGSSQIALVANSNNIPVLVCCETYKFSERVDTDSFVHNELEKELLDVSKSSQQTSNYLNSLNFIYDVTPPDFVSVVITEIGVLPCTSAPAVLRFRETK